ncbi:MAG: putative quinol monooxygenase [Rhodocyclaceae bacterium]
MPIHVITLAEALPQHVDAVSQQLSHMAQLTRMAEGCLRCDVYVASGGPRHFNTIEVWVSADAHAAWIQSAPLLKAIAPLFGKMKGLPEVRVLDVITELEH